MTAARLWAKIRDRYQLSLSRWAAQRVVPLRNRQPLVSFTFDDFPRTALALGGSILQAHHLRGTYYTALGLMNRAESPVGPTFTRDDLPAAIGAGHELGCHTFSHCHAWNTPPDEFEQSLLANQNALRELLPDAGFKTMSYPIGVPRPRTKRITGGYFAACRGGGQTFNAGTMDLNNLRALFIEKATPEFMQAVIQQNAQSSGWLIFATHDVAEQPTRFGCTPQRFETVVRQAVESGAAILPVSEALEAALSGRN
jgi:peptidoglycan/xylan/chitin deacetylase (PgdA/CDA1 family)